MHINKIKQDFLKLKSIIENNKTWWAGAMKAINQQKTKKASADQSAQDKTYQT
jgi:hypothetical protein